MSASSDVFRLECVFASKKLDNQICEDFLSALKSHLHIT